MGHSLDDYRWLVSDAARAYLNRATSDSSSLVSLTKSLRSELSAQRTHLILDQVELRRRAKKKFSAAERMFYTRELLEQATGETIAAYKASRFPREATVADLCCGIGGDTLGLAARGPTAAVDQNAVACLFTEQNFRVAGLAPVDALVQDATTIDVKDFTAWHIDPDRRSTGKRTTHPDRYEPSRAAIDELLLRQPNAAVKLAPATAAPADWAQRAEIEFIGHRGECKQQIAWFGSLANHSGLRVATILTGENAVCKVVGRVDGKLDVADEIGNYLYEPHAAVRAAGLGGHLAAQYGLQAATPGDVFLTADKLIDDGALNCFEVTDVMPFDFRKLRRLMRHRRIGHLEVKHRGGLVEPDTLARRLRGNGDQSATLIVIRSTTDTKAILARRRSK